MFLDDPLRGNGNLMFTLFLSCRDKSTTSGIPSGIEIGYCESVYEYL